MTKVDIEGEKLVVHLEGLEEIEAIKKELEIPLNCIEKAAYVKDLDEEEKRKYALS